MEKGSVMKERRTWLKLEVVLIGLGVALAGCAMTQNNKAIDMERLLVAAGFQIRPADTPEKLAHLETLTQRHLVRHEQDGKVHYVYADAIYCKCSYVGTEEAYRRYQKLAFDKAIADEKRQAGVVYGGAGMDWRTWTAWGP